MHILVLGGTRFIGAATVRRLSEMGHVVAVFHRGQTEASLPADVYHFHGDRQQLQEYARDFRDFAPDVVLDMLALTESDGRQLVRLFKGIASRAVAISSGDVYRAYDRFRRADPGLPDPTPLTETSPLRDRLFPYRDQTRAPDDFYYNYEKILMERALISDPDLPATILRLPMVYGPGDYQHRLFDYLKRMDDGRPVILISRATATWRGMYGYVENIAEAIALCISHEQSVRRIFHIADQANLTELEWIHQIASAVNWGGHIIPLDDEFLPPCLKQNVDFGQDLSLDSSQIRKELGFIEPIKLDEAIQRTVAWERANPPGEIDQSRFDYAAEDEALAFASGKEEK